MKDMTPELIAREEECAKLRKCLRSKRSEFVIVSGRRRVGKTFLIDRFFEEKYDFSFVGVHHAPTRVQLRNFHKALKKYSGKCPEPFGDWYDAFDALEAYLESLPKKGKKVVFIDEMPWIDTLRSEFVAALENFWNGWAMHRYDIVFIASGSATSWMADNLEENQGGLHNRITAKLHLSPFTLHETEQYMRMMGFPDDRYQILQCYMFTGGVPFYLSLLDPLQSVAQNIDRLCFEEKGQLRHEFDELYDALFTNSEAYRDMVRLLNAHKKGLTRKEIAERVSLNGKRLTKVLLNLERCDFITRRAVFGKKTTVYRLVDFYTLFYFKFLESDRSLDEKWFTHNMAGREVGAWMGLTFELICLQHHRQIKKALGISGMATSVSTWRYTGKNKDEKGAQIDMLIKRADRMIHLCEMKFSTTPYSIKGSYAEALRERMGIFNEVTGNMLAVVHTFVTTFGLSKGMHNGMVHSEVTMKDLFTKAE